MSYRNQEGEVSLSTQRYGSTGGQAGEWASQLIMNTCSPACLHLVARHRLVCHPRAPYVGVVDEVRRLSGRKLKHRSTACRSKPRLESLVVHNLAQLGVASPGHRCTEGKGATHSPWLKQMPLGGHGLKLRQGSSWLVRCCCKADQMRARFKRPAAAPCAYRNSQVPRQKGRRKMSASPHARGGAARSRVLIAIGSASM